MSDDESDYYSDSPNDSDEESVNIVPKKQNIPLNAVKKFGNYVEDDYDSDESDDGEQIGGEDDEEPEIEVEDDEEKDDLDDYGEDNELEKQQVNQTNQKNKKNTNQLIIEDDEENEDEYDENYLQKFDSELNKNYISEFHAECLNHNYDEVLKLAKVTRDSNNIIIDKLHKTIPYLTKYEKARILGQRAKQIETGSKPFVKVPENIIDGNIIAELELREKKIPFIIRRPIPGGAFEYWHLRDLEIISF